MADPEDVVLEASEQVQERPTGALTHAGGRRVLLVFASFIFSLSVLEFPAFIGVVDYGRLIGPRHAQAASFVFDRELHWIKPPYAHQSGEIRGGNITWDYQIPESHKTLYQWDVRYDQNGFRNELDLASAGKIVIGDSFVEGATVPTPQLTTSLLAHAHGDAVANLALPGYGPQQELIVLKRYGLPLHPGVVIWMFSESSDLKDVIHFRSTLNRSRKFLSAFHARSFTANALAEVKRRFFPPVKPSGVKRAGIIQTSNREAVTIYFPVRSGPLTADDLSALDETAQIIAEANKLSRAQGARFVFVFIPDKFRVFHDFCSFPEASECRNWVVNDLPERMRKAITSIAPDIGYVDLTPNLIDAVKRGQLPYYPDDAHWSPEGHKIAADTINGYLSSSQKRSLPN